MKKNLIVIGMMLGSGLMPLAAMAAGGASASVPKTAKTAKTDPFTNHQLEYEKYLKIASLEQVKQKILESKYQIARYQAQISAIKNRSQSAAQGSASKVSKRISALESKVNQLDSEITAIRSSRNRNNARPVLSRQQQTNMSLANIHLVGFVRNADGNRQAWIQNGQSLRLVHGGQKIYGQPVSFVGSGAMKIGYKTYHLINQGGSIGVSGDISSSKSDQVGEGMAFPGSTPQSAAMMHNQGRSAIMSALQHH